MTVSSISFPSEQGLAFVGTSKTIPATVKGSDGSTLVDRTIAWTTNDATVATVADGIVTPLAAGNVRITGTVENRVAFIDLVVNATAPATLAELKSLFANPAVNGSFVVKSDIDQAYSQQQLDHLLKSWNFLGNLFGVTPGSFSEMYYTWDRALVQDLGGVVCPASDLANLPGRLLRTCVEAGGNLTFLVAPAINSNGVATFDFATALSTLGQAFSARASSAFYTWPWLFEGLGATLKAGTFDAGGVYTMGNLVSPELNRYKENVDVLLPLSGTAGLDLVELTRDKLDPSVVSWSQNSTVAYPQSGMLVNYLYRNHQAEFETLIKEIASQTVTSSQQAFDRILELTNLTVEQLDTAYKAHGAEQ